MNFNRLLLIVSIIFGATVKSVNANINESECSEAKGRWIKEHCICPGNGLPVGGDYICHDGLVVKNSISNLNTNAIQLTPNINENVKMHQPIIDCSDSESLINKKIKNASDYSKDITEYSQAEIDHLPFDPVDYTTDRGIDHYKSLFSIKNFEKLNLSNYLGNFDNKAIKWVDVGAGLGTAQRDHIMEHNPVQDGSSYTAIAKFLPRNKHLIFQGIADLPKHSNYHYFLIDAETRLPESYTGSVNLLTDIHGAISYTQNLTGILYNYGNYLTPGGRAYLVTNDQSFKISDDNGKELSLTEFLSQNVRGFDIHTGPASERKGIVNLFMLERNQNEVYIPALKIHYVDTTTNPPTRVFISPHNTNYVYDPIEGRFNSLVDLKAKYSEEKINDEIKAIEAGSDRLNNRKSKSNREIVTLRAFESKMQQFIHLKTHLYPNSVI